MSEIRTRFAPSPTGFMHIGNLRTALFSWLVAKSQGGKFVLRVEDTDQARKVEGAEEVIKKTLETAGLAVDEGLDDNGPFGPYHQSKRLDIYEKYAKLLVESGNAYYCFCDNNTGKDENSSGYDRKCRSLSQSEVEERLKAGEKHVIRQKIPLGRKLSYHDEVFGDIEVDSDSLDDQILLKSDGFPTYNFANVIDDHLMEITHVVRGSEYLISTPKYNLLYEAFGWTPPKYVHLPLINGRDEDGKVSKLSKRHGSVNFNDLVGIGYLPEAILNCILLLGWSPKTDQEIFTIDEAIKNFKISGVSKSPAVFDYTKLDWFNFNYVKKMDLEKFTSWALQFVKSSALRSKWSEIAPLIHEKTTRPTMIDEMLSFVEHPSKCSAELFLNDRHKITLEGAVKTLKWISSKIEPSFTRDDYDRMLHEYAEANGVKFGYPMWIFRVALARQRDTCIGGYEIASLIGNTEVARRVDEAIAELG